MAGQVQFDGSGRRRGKSQAPCPCDPARADSRAAQDAVPEPPDGMPAGDQLYGMRALLTLCTVMTEKDDQDHILRLAATSVSTLGNFRFHGAHLNHIGWRDAPGAHPGQGGHHDLETQFAVLGAAGGAVAVPGESWAWAYPLCGLDDHLGYLVIGADREPLPGGQFLLRVLAHQTGIAIGGARRRARQRADADRLRAANTALSEAVAELAHSTNVHERLTAVATAEEGPGAIADALHELTGFSIAVEDRHGNLRAWSGPGRPDPYPKEEHAAREETLRAVARDGPQLRRGGRLVVPVGPRGQILGLLVLLDPEGRAGQQEIRTLDHAATVLALQLARMNSLAEAEQRLGRDLVDELLSGADEATALARAEALGYDLCRPHRAVVVTVAGPHHGTEVLRAVRDAAHDTGTGSLVAARGEEIVVLSDADRAWPRFQAAVRRELGGGDCRVGVGGAYARPAGAARSHHEACLALRLRAGCASDPRVVEFDRLGVYRLLAGIDDHADVERFVGDWLGDLLAYDQAHRTELVGTLSHYLECGRRYRTSTAALAIHRSTLKYRIQRIREISGHDLGDPDVCFNLQLATRAWQTLEALRAGSA